MSKFESEWEENYNSFYLKAFSLTNNVEDSKDLVQEAAIKAFKSYERFDGRYFNAWGQMIVRNHFIGDWKKKNVRSAILPIPLDISEITEKNGVAQKSNSVEFILFNNELSESMQFVLKSLPAEQAKALILHSEGLSGKEIEKLLGINGNTVRTRIHRAKGNARKILENLSKG